MSNSDRKVSLAEVRAAIREAFGETMSADAVERKIVERLTKPRLRDDCPVEAISKNADEKVLARAWQILEWEVRDVRPLVRADRVMEWAEEWLEDYETGGLQEYFARRIREETEVTDE